MNITTSNYMLKIKTQKSIGVIAVLSLYIVSTYVITMEQFKDITHYQDYYNPRQSSAYAEQIIAGSYSIKKGEKI